MPLAIYYLRNMDNPLGYVNVKLPPFQAILLASALLSLTPVMAEPPLPWEKDYAGALAKAKGEKRPLFLMLTATGRGPCKLLESQTLPSPAVFSGLKEFVWVKAYEDAALNEKFNVGGWGHPKQPSGPRVATLWEDYTIKTTGVIRPRRVSKINGAVCESARLQGSPYSVCQIGVGHHNQGDIG
jgi:hypothetical protein